MPAPIPAADPNEVILDQLEFLIAHVRDDHNDPSDLLPADCPICQRYGPVLLLLLSPFTC